MRSRPRFAIGRHAAGSRRRGCRRRDIPARERATSSRQTPASSTVAAVVGVRHGLRGLDAIHVASALELTEFGPTARLLGRAPAPRRPRRGPRRLPRDDDRSLEVVARRVGEQRRHALEPDLVGDQPLERVGAAAEERERRAHVPRRVVERALAASPPRSGCGTGRPGSAPRAAGRRRRARCRPAARARARGATPRRCRPPRSRRRRPRPSPVSAPKSGASARRSGREPTPTGQPPASATHAQSISPIGPSPITATVSPAETPAASTPCRQQASGSTIAATSGGIPGGTGSRFVRAMRSGTRMNSA